jgi:hypothetical protein
VNAGPSALLLEGTAGIGKTTLWLSGVAAAREAGFRVLVTRAAESEARMAYTALGDLFEQGLDEVLPELLTQQRTALEAALLRGGARVASPDPRAVSLAATSAIRALEASGPLIVAIDDVQWLDVSSARVISFVLRRLARERVGVLASLRLGGGSVGDRLELARAMT